MSLVVCEPCRDCKYTDCVTVCPCDCFYQDERQLYIDPSDCIDCEACMPECPVGAIFPELQVPAAWTQFIQLNAERVAALKTGGGHITERQAPKVGPGCRGIGYHPFIRSSSFR
jgi:ferredoxin